MRKDLLVMFSWASWPVCLGSMSSGCIKSLTVNGFACSAKSHFMSGVHVVFGPAGSFGKSVLLITQVLRNLCLLDRLNALLQLASVRIASRQNGCSSFCVIESSVWSPSSSRSDGVAIFPQPENK